MIKKAEYDARIQLFLSVERPERQKPETKLRVFVTCYESAGLVHFFSN